MIAVILVYLLGWLVVFGKDADNDRMDVFVAVTWPFNVVGYALIILVRGGRR